MFGVLPIICTSRSPHTMILIPAVRSLVPLPRFSNAFAFAPLPQYIGSPGLCELFHGRVLHPIARLELRRGRGVDAERFFSVGHQRRQLQTAMGADAVQEFRTCPKLDTLQKQERVVQQHLATGGEGEDLQRFLFGSKTVRGEADPAPELEELKVRGEQARIVGGFFPESSLDLQRPFLLEAVPEVEKHTREVATVADRPQKLPTFSQKKFLDKSVTDQLQKRG